MVFLARPQFCSAKLSGVSSVGALLRARNAPRLLSYETYIFFRRRLHLYVVCAASRWGKIKMSLMDFRRFEELGTMQDICTYQIEVCGQVDESAFNATSPLQMTVVRMNPATTLLATCTDQSGLIGLIRHLHGHGFVLLSVTCEG